MRNTVYEIQILQGIGILAGRDMEAILVSIDELILGMGFIVFTLYYHKRKWRNHFNALFPSQICVLVYKWQTADFRLGH